MAATVTQADTYPYETMTLKDLRVLALAAQGETDSQNHYGAAIMNRWINEGLRQLWKPAGGVMDTLGVDSPWYLSVGVRAYPLPRGFKRPYRVTVNGLIIPCAKPTDHDYYSIGNSLPLFYTIEAKPYSKILFGPLPPDSAYAAQVWFKRTPYAMLADTDRPEAHPDWVTAPAIWASGKMARADGNMDLMANCFEEFAALQRDLVNWLRESSEDNYMTVTYACEY